MRHSTEIPGGRIIEDSAVIPDGKLVVKTHTQYVYLDSIEADGEVITLREAFLNGKLVTDPARARRLASDAGIQA